MSTSQSERRLAENEVRFRKLNEKMHNGFKEVNRLAREDNQFEFIVGDNTEVGFFCECSNPQCTMRIRLTLQDYGWVRKRADQFIVMTGHEDPRVERVVSRHGGYSIVEKNSEALKV